MRFIFRMYSVIWMLVLILYFFNWSEFSFPLSPGLFVFITFSIITCLILSFCIKDIKVEKTKLNKNIYFITKLIILLYFINFIYAGYIPFFGIITGDNKYTEFPGIPVLYAFLVPFSLYIYIVLISNFLYNTKNIKPLLYSFSLVFMFLLIFSRSMILLALLSMGYIFYRKNKKKINFKIILLLIIVAIFSTYLFGVLGNLRSGGRWNDSSYIEELGLFNRYPKFLPKQFMWAYLYIITPLSNLNFNVINSNHIFSFQHLAVSFVPEFISKRLFSSYIISSLDETLLVKTYFNAQTVYVESFYSVGILGCYLTFFVIIIIGLMFNYFLKKYRCKTIYVQTTYLIFVSLSFFYNVFFYMLTSFLIVIDVIYILYLRRNYKNARNKYNSTNI